VTSSLGVLVPVQGLTDGCSENRTCVATAQEAAKPANKTHGGGEAEGERAPTFVFFSGLGGSSLLGGAVMSFPVTASAALGSSGFAGGEIKGNRDLVSLSFFFLTFRFF